MVARGAVLVHVATGEHGDLVDGPQHPERSRPGAGNAQLDRGARPRSGTRPSLARSPRHRHLGLAGGDGHGGLAHDTTAGPASVADLAEEGDLPAPDVADDVDLLGGLHRVGAQGVDLGRVDAGVRARVDDHRARQLRFGGLEVLGKRRLGDAGDGGGVLEADCRAHRTFLLGPGPKLGSAELPGVEGTVAAT